MGTVIVASNVSIHPEIGIDPANGDNSGAAGEPLSGGVRTAIVGCLLFLAGSGAYYVMPAYLAAAAAQMQLDARQVGLLSGAENLGLAIACLLTSLLLDRIGRRVIFTCALICVAGDILSGMVGHFGPLLAVRFLTGLLGEGPCYAASFVVLGMSPKPDRAIGIAMTLIVLVAAGTLGWSSDLLRPMGAAGLLAPFAISALALMAALGGLPRMNKMDAIASTPADHKADHEADHEADREADRRAITTLLAMCLWFAAPGLFWAFAETAAIAHGASQIGADRALSLATIVGFVGSMLPVVLGDRAGRLVPIAVTTFGLFLAAFFYNIARGQNEITIGLSLISISWNCSAVYQLAALTTLDRTGVFSGLGAVAQLLGLALGPLIGGALIVYFGYGVVPVAMGCMSLAGLALFGKALLRRRIAAPT